MSSTNDAAPPDLGGASPSRSLVPVNQPAEGGAGPEQTAPPKAWLRAARFGVPVALFALTGAMGWFAGAHSGAANAAAERAGGEAALKDELKAQSARLAALEAQVTAQLAKTNGAAQAQAPLKPAIEILAQRIDEIARRQTLALTQTSTRLDRSDKGMAARLDQLSERIERVEKQVSSSAAVGATQKSVTSVGRSAPAAPKTADAERAVRGYVLRDVFGDGALVESRYGLMEVFPGVQLPGAGRVRSVEKRAGRWVVVTTAGVIHARR